MNFQPSLEAIRDKLRATPFLVAALIGAVWLGLFQPQKLSVLIWLITKISAAGYIGYVLDRVIFPYHRISKLHKGDQDLWLIRRAIIIAACVMASGGQW